jgi:hypothetical protein
VATVHRTPFILKLFAKGTCTFCFPFMVVSIRFGLEQGVSMTISGKMADHLNREK